MRAGATLLLAVAVAFAGPEVGLPADCRVALHVDFDALRKLEVWPRIAQPLDALLRDDFHLGGLLEGAGVRVDRDLSSITLALCGDDVAGGPETVAIARGTIDAARFGACMADNGFRTNPRDGTTVFDSADTTMAFALFDGGLLFADPVGRLDGLRAGFTRGREASAMSKLLALAPAAHIHLAFASTPQFRDQARKLGGDALAGLRSAWVTLDVGQPCTVAFAGDTESEEAAQKLLDAALPLLPALGHEGRGKLERQGTALKGVFSLSLEDAAAIVHLEPAPAPGNAARPAVRVGGPTIKGSGKLMEFTLSGQFNSITVAPGEGYVFVQRAQESSVVLDADLRVVTKRDGTYGRMGFALDGKTALWIVPGGAEVRSIPSLDLIREVRERVAVWSEWSVCPLADGTAFAIVAWSGVRLFHLDPPRWGNQGRPAIQRPIAGAIDPKTGLLVMIGDDTTFEMFDPQTLESLGTLSLPCSKVAFDVAAAGGRAWVATKDGTIVPVDIAPLQVLVPVRVADGGDVHLALSSSGKTLAVVADQFVDALHHPAVARVYEVVEGTLREIASARFVAAHSVSRIALLESRRTVLLAGARPLVWRY